MPLALDCEGEALVVLVTENVLDVSIANLEREAQIWTLVSWLAIVCIDIGMLGYLGTETALLLADLKMFLIKRIFKLKI